MREGVHVPALKMPVYEALRAGRPLDAPTEQGSALKRTHPVALVSDRRHWGKAPRFMRRMPLAMVVVLTNPRRVCALQARPEDAWREAPSSPAFSMLGTHKWAATTPSRTRSCLGRLPLCYLSHAQRVRQTTG